MGWLTGILAVVVLFGAMISLHELGHFLVARLARMRVHEYALGFGPALASFRWGDTRYSLRLFPLGGFVRIAGLEPGEDVPDGFDKKPVPSRMATIAAGSFMNLAMAALILAVIAYFFSLATTTRIEALEPPEGPAAQAGLRPGDWLVGVNRRVAADDVEAFQRVIAASPGKPLRLHIMRRGRLLSVEVVPEELPISGSASKRARIGVRFSAVPQYVSPARALLAGAQETYRVSIFMFVYVGKMITGKEKRDVAGPVGVTQLIVQEAKKGLLSYLSLAALITINVAWINLLPIPALDGSRLLFLLLEVVRRRPLDKRKEALVHLIGFALIIGLVLLVTYYDLLRIRSGRPIGG